MAVRFTLRWKKKVGPGYNTDEIIVSHDDAYLVRGQPWVVGYRGTDRTVQRRGASGDVIYLPRLLMGAKTGQAVGHRNGDTRDCRRSNMYLETDQEHMRRMTLASAAARRPEPVAA